MHGLGSIAHALNVHRGDRMEFLVSLSSDQFGLTAYAKEKFGEASEYAQADYAKGDMDSTEGKAQNVFYSRWHARNCCCFT